MLDLQRTDGLGVLMVEQTHKGRVWSFLAILIAYLAVTFDILGIGVLLPKMQPALSLSFSQMQWVVNIYIIVMAGMILIAGKLANRVGFRRLFLNGIVIFAIGSVFCGAANGAVMELVGRGIQGIGSAIIFPIGVAIVKRISPPDRASEYLGFFISMTTSALAFGGTISGMFVQFWNWRFFFYLNIPIAVIAYVALTICLKPMIQRERVPIDWLGLVLLFIAIVGTVFGFMNMPLYGWKSVWILGAFAVAIIALIAFSVWQLRVKFPLIKFSLLRNHRINSLLIGLACMQAGFMLFNFIMIFVQTNWGYDPIKAGMIGFIVGVPMILVSAFHGRIAQVFSEARSLLLGAIAMLLGFILLIFSAYHGFPWLFFSLILLGVGLPTILTSGLALSMEMTREKDHALMTSMIYSARYIGAAVGFAIQSLLINVSGHHFNTTHTILVNHYVMAICAAVIFSVVSVVLAAGYFYWPTNQRKIRS